ncbi:MAG: hypothetical protein ABL996_04930 [Micropepsaceae bacterium]
MTKKPSEFYVGYLALPPGLRWVLCGLVVLLAGLVALDAWLVASFQPEAGDGKWGQTPKEFVGTLSRAPYPSLRVRENGTVRTYVLISDEKRSSDKELGSIADGASIKVNGYEIERSAVGMIQLVGTGADITLANDVPAISEEPRELHGRTALKGEIVDSKCWLGVMRPGDGHIHKACASLCIRGGIPPMFVVRGGDGPQVYLLTLFDGNAVPPQTILDYIADPVSLAGVVEKRGDIFLFKADLATLKRTQ